jgi:hypothetical protein
VRYSTSKRDVLQEGRAHRGGFGGQKHQSSALRGKKSLFQNAPYSVSFETGSIDKISKKNALSLEAVPKSQILERHHYSGVVQKPQFLNNNH